MSYILSIETGTNICSVALSEDGRLLSLRESGAERNHATNLAIFIDEVLKENDISSDELSAVAVSKGPGSYTGLRIGVSVAKAIAYASNIPLLSVSSLQSMAMVALDDYNAGLLNVENIDSAILCPMIDARRMEVYAQLFDFSAEELTKVSALIIDENSFSDMSSGREFVIFGTGALKCKDIIKAEKLIYYNLEPSARGMVAIAHKLLDTNKKEDIAYFEPFYLKDFVAGVSKKTILSM